MKSFFQNRKPGFWLTVVAACLALIGAIAYLIAYAAIARGAKSAFTTLLAFIFLKSLTSYSA